MKPLPPGEQRTVTIPLDKVAKTGIGAWRKISGLFKKKREDDDDGMVRQNSETPGPDGRD